MRTEPQAAIAPETWTRVQAAIARIEALPPCELEALLPDLLAVVAQFAGGDSAFLVLTQRLPDLPEDDPAFGWRAFKVLRQVRAVPEGFMWFELNPEYIDDPLMRLVFARAGTHRAYAEMQEHDRGAWGEIPSRINLRLRKAEDRLVGIFSVRDDVEVGFVGERALGGERFGDVDVDAMLLVLAHLGKVASHIARMHGALDASGPLSPRERETLRELLRGLSEKQIAEVLDLSRATVHQYVTQIYRKFGVSGRAELMALWINGR